MGFCTLKVEAKSLHNRNKLSLNRKGITAFAVNFRSTTRSIKDKAKIHRPKEEWKVFENTHEAIIDNETWELVQELRSHKRRPNHTSEISIFSGLLYCADCGEKLYYSVTNNYCREQTSKYRMTKPQMCQNLWKKSGIIRKSRNLRLPSSMSLLITLWYQKSRS